MKTQLERLYQIEIEFKALLQGPVINLADENFKILKNKKAEAEENLTYLAQESQDIKNRSDKKSEGSTLSTRLKEDAKQEKIKIQAEEKSLFNWLQQFELMQRRMDNYIKQIEILEKVKHPQYMENLAPIDIHSHIEFYAQAIHNPAKPEFKKTFEQLHNQAKALLKTKLEKIISEAKSLNEFTQVIKLFDYDLMPSLQKKAAELFEAALNNSKNTKELKEAYEIFKNISPNPSDLDEKFKEKQAALAEPFDVNLKKDWQAYWKLYDEKLKTNNRSEAKQEDRMAAHKEVCALLRIDNKIRDYIVDIDRLIFKQENYESQVNSYRQVYISNFNNEFSNGYMKFLKKEFAIKNPALIELERQGNLGGFIQNFSDDNFIAIMTRLYGNIQKKLENNIVLGEFFAQLIKLSQIAKAIKAVQENDPLKKVENIFAILNANDNYLVFAKFFNVFGETINLMGKFSSLLNQAELELLEQGLLSSGEKIGSVLITPTQWLPRYILLLRDCKKEALENKSNDLVEKFSDLESKFDEFTVKINEEKRKLENVEALAHLKGGRGKSSIVASDEINTQLDKVINLLDEYVKKQKVNKTEIKKEIDNLISMIVLKISGKAARENLSSTEIDDLKTMCNNLSALIYFAKELRQDEVYFSVPVVQLRLRFEKLEEKSEDKDYHYALDKLKAEVNDVYNAYFGHERKRIEEQLKTLQFPWNNELRQKLVEKLGQAYPFPQYTAASFFEIDASQYDETTRQQIMAVFPQAIDPAQLSVAEAVLLYNPPEKLTEVTASNWERIKTELKLNISLEDFVKTQVRSHAAFLQQDGKLFYREQNRVQFFIKMIEEYCKKPAADKNIGLLGDLTNRLDTIQQFLDKSFKMLAEESIPNFLPALEKAIQQIIDKIHEFGDESLSQYVAGLEEQKQLILSMQDNIEDLSYMEMNDFNGLEKKYQKRAKNEHFEGYHFVRNMSGGVNEKGEFAGVYEIAGQNYHIKQDSKGGDPRHHKNMAEVIGGSIIQAVLEDKSLSAEVSFIKDRKKNGIYVASKEFKGYRGDFWAFAYNLYNKDHPGNPKTMPAGRPRRAGSSPEIQEVMRYALKIIAQSNPNFKKEFAEIMVASLLIGDFDVHIGNVGVVEKDGVFHLVRLDFGAALKDLEDDIHPHSHSKHFPLTSLMPGEQKLQPTNHFREYPRELRVSTEMADVLEHQASIDLSDVIKTKMQELQDNFDEKDIRLFANYIGIKPKETKSLDKTALLEKIKLRFAEKMKNRQSSLKQFAFEIRAGLCIGEKGEIDKNKVKALYQTHSDYVWQSLADNKLHLRTSKSKNIFIEWKYRRALLKAFKEEMGLGNANLAHPTDEQLAEVKNRVAPLEGKSKWAGNYLKRLLNNQVKARFKNPEKIRLQGAFKDIENSHLREAIMGHLLKKPYTIELPEESVLKNIIAEINKLTHSTENFFKQYHKFLEIVKPIVGLNDLQSEFIGALIAEGKKPQYNNLSHDDLKKYIAATKVAISFVQQINKEKSKELKAMLKDMKAQEKQMTKAEKKAVGKMKKLQAEEAKASRLTIATPTAKPTENIERVWEYKSGNQFKEITAPKKIDLRQETPMIVEYADRFTYKSTSQAVQAGVDNIVVQKMVDLAFKKFDLPDDPILSVDDLKFAGKPEMVAAAKEYAYEKLYQKALKLGEAVVKSLEENGYLMEEPNKVAEQTNKRYGVRVKN